jgi:histone deacetylase 1/2
MSERSLIPLRFSRARAWSYETGICIGQEMPEDLPFHEYYGYYGPDFKLAIRPSTAVNQNSRQYLDSITTKILENLKQVTFAPSVQMSDIPQQSMGMTDEEEAELNNLDEDMNKDVRNTQHREDKMVAHDDGYASDSEGEDDALTPRPPKRRKAAA